ncbi:MAG: Holliday junction branch migration protein RuvA [Candidatus Obscuribacterales bacterium]|nr:Holliday junction branch migration protein RuvA [Steroidobacteraceae bacterium]
MIGFLRGKLVAKHPPHLVIDVGGIGYELDAPMSTFYGLPPVGADITLQTHLVVREDAHILFGFGSERERRMFRELLKVSNVGPKLALAILSGITVDTFLLCIEAGDADALVKVPGVGRKTAERLIVELRDRVKGFGEVGFSVGGTVGSSITNTEPHAEAFSALVALGYKPVEVTRLLKSVNADALSTEEIIRQALKAASMK